MAAATPAPPPGSRTATSPKAIQTGGGAQIAGTPTSPCLIAYPSTSLPVVGTVGGACLISKTNVRAMAGGLLLGMGGLIFVGGVVVLVAAGFKKTGALNKAAGAAAVIPGGQGVAAGLRAAGSPGRTVARRRRESAASEERQRRQVGEPRENPSLRVGAGAVRETPAGTRRRRAERDEEPPY